MSNEVYANMMEVSCKSASGKTICAFPDVCMTPPQTPATPPGVPIPYPNTGMGSDTTDGSTSVKISNKEVMLKNKSCFSKSTGDEAGAAPKKGLVTSKNTGKVYFNMWSMDVKVEGENVVRHLDITTHNHASTPGNSPPMPHTDGMSPGGGGDAESCPLGGSCSVGSPVNPVTGAKVLGGAEDADFTLPGPMPLDWQRFYLSSNADVGWFGRGWSSPLEARLEATPDPSGERIECVAYVDHFGRRTVFEPLEPGGSHFSVTDKLTLSRSQAGQYQLATTDGVTRRFSDREQATYNLVSMTDRNGNAVIIDRSRADAGILSVSCSGGQQLELVFEHDRLTKVVELRQESGSGTRKLLMRYDYTKPGGDLCGVHNRAEECTRRFGYTAERLMCKQVRHGVFEAEYAYAKVADEWRVQRHWDNVGRSWSFAYADWHSDVTDQDGRLTRYHFDRLKRLIGVTDAQGHETQVGLDRQGNVRTTIDRGGHVVETKFDERGNPVEVCTPDGAVHTLEWHPELQLMVAMTDPLKCTTKYEYDAHGNLITEINALGAETRHRYDGRGLLVASTNPNGGISRRAYNQQGLLTQYTDCSGNATHYHYNADGWLVSTMDALGRVTRFEYDAAGRLVCQVLPDGSNERYESDVAGRLTAVIDANGHRTEYRYEPDGPLAQTTDALGHVATYRYDRARRLIELVNENGASYRFTYDALDRLIEETRFDGSRVRLRYGAAGHLIETIEQPDSVEQIVFRYVRDALGRLLVRESLGGALASFEYDAAGQRVAAHAHNPRVSVYMDYDAVGRRTAEKVIVGERSFAIAHTYDAMGNRLRTKLPDGREVCALYYGCGNVHQISLGQEPVTDFERDALHREVSRSQGLLRSARSYDLAGRLQLQSAAPAAIQRRFEYDPAGRLICATEHGGHELRYVYDDIDQLVLFNNERFAYDPAHNRVSAGKPTRVYDNLVAELEDYRFSYDAHGRLTEKRGALGSVLSLRWNDEHRLVSSTLTDDRGSRSVHYVYDAFGRRVAKRCGDTTTWFVWDRDRLLQAHEDGGDVATFFYEPETFAPLALAVTSAGQSKADATLIYHYHCDQVGQPRELTDQHGQLVWAGTYSGWGRLLLAETEPDAPSQPLRMQGEYADAETGLHYNLMRYFDPDASRFASKDPLGLEGGVNEYRFAPNPVFWIDPQGLTGTYIFTDGTTSYVGKGPVDRCRASQSARLGSTCGATAAVHEDFGDDDMGFMVEHLLMEHYNARASASFANSPNLNSPGKKKYEAADAATKKKVRAKRDAMIKKFEAKKAACATPAGPPANNGNC